MKKKKQMYALLAAALVLAGGYSLFSLAEKRKVQDPEGSETTSPALETWTLTEEDETGLNAVSLQNKKGAFTLTREGGEWFIENRRELTLDGQAVVSFLSVVSRMVSFERISPDGADPEEYGLAEDADSLTLKHIDGTETILRIGSSNPSGSGRYIRKEGDPAIYLLPSYTAGMLLADIDALRDRSLPPLNGQELTYIKIESDTTVEIVPFFQFEKFANSMSPFVLIQPYKRPVPVDTEEISQGLESFFSGLSIQSFADEGTPLSVTGLDDSARSLYMKDKTGRELTLLIGEENGEGEYYCSIPGKPGIFTLKKETLSLADTKPFDLADHFIRLVGIDLVDGLTVRSPAGTWTGEIKRIDEKTTDYYFQGEQIEEELFKKVYQEVLYLLSEGEISGGFRPGKPIITIEYRGNSENPGKTRADFFEYNQDFYAAGIDGYEPEFLIGKYQLKNLQDYLKNFPPVE